MAQTEFAYTTPRNSQNDQNGNSGEVWDKCIDALESPDKIFSYNSNLIKNTNYACTDGYLAQLGGFVENNDYLPLMMLLRKKVLMPFLFLMKH